MQQMYPGVQDFEVFKIQIVYKQHQCKAELDFFSGRFHLLHLLPLMLAADLPKSNIFLIIHIFGWINANPGNIQEHWKNMWTVTSVHVDSN